MITRFDLMAAILQPANEAFHLPNVFVTNDRGLRDDTRVSFQVQKPNRPIEFKIHLRAIQQMKKRQIVLLETQMLKRVDQLFRLVEKIRQNNHQSSPSDLLRE